MQVPAQWPAPTDQRVSVARRRVAEVLSDTALTSGQLAEYYDPSGDFAGHVFDQRADSDPNDVSASDLLAITTMQVQAAPRAVTNFLTDGQPRQDVINALRATDDVPLWTASSEQLSHAAAFYTTVKKTLGGTNMWVTASKLCARKRPALIPVRDSVIAEGLGLPGKDFREDWLIIGKVLEDTHLREQLQDAAEAADPAGSTVLSSVPELRLLDAVLWRRWSQATRGGGQRR
jgi:hypothetical protein